MRVLLRGQVRGMVLTCGRAIGGAMESTGEREEEMERVEVEVWRLGKPPRFGVVAGTVKVSAAIIANISMVGC